jgi:hypothetical protein
LADGCDTKIGFYNFAPRDPAELDGRDITELMAVREDQT